MDKNSIIGFVLIGVIFFGFTWYQSNQYQKQREYQAQLDSIAYAEQAALMAEQDSIARASGIMAAESGTAASSGQKKYLDSLLNSRSNAEAGYVTLANDKLELVLSTKGAQPYSARLNDYRTYDSTDLYLIKPGYSDYNIAVFAGENINTREVVFDVAETTDSSVVMRLPFRNGGYLEQKYILPEDSYMVRNEMSFVNAEGLIPRKINSFDIDWNVVIPRLEKGYRNEMQYSKLDYCYPGEKKPEQIGRGGRSDEERVDSKVNWFAFQQQFFSAIMRAGEDFSSAAFGIKFFEEDDPDRNLMVCYADMRSEFDLSAGGDVTIPYEFYFGPNHYRTLKSYDQHYERIIPLGGSVIGLISRWVIIPVFNFLGRFIENFGIIILLLTVLIKLVVSPLTMKSYISSAKMSVLKPEMDKLNEKYPRQEDALKKQQAMMNLYRRAGVSPMGGCLPMLLQLPILYAMFRFFPASIELRQQPFLWADDLSAYDSILNLPFNIPLYGDHVSLFALLMALSMFIYSKMTSSQMSSDPSMAGMKFMSVWLMPIMMLFICNNLSSGLSYYYLLSNLITMLQTWFVKRYVVKPEKIHAMLAATEGKPMPKSKWQQRLEEAQKMQQQMAKEQARRRR